MAAAPHRSHERHCQTLTPASSAHMCATAQHATRLLHPHPSTQVLGIIGALDPHTHKLNLAQLQGEGRLEREGVRPQFPNKNPPELGGLPGGEQALDLLPSAGLVTSSEDYYPTVAINALMRVLREPSAAALHGKAVAALFEIIKAMGLAFVPYLHKVRAVGRGVGLCGGCTEGSRGSVTSAGGCRALCPCLHHAPRTPTFAPQVVPVLLQLTRGADDLQRRVDMVRALTDLVVLMRQHVRKFLPDLLGLVNDFWGTAPAMLPHILSLLAELSREWGWAGVGGGLQGRRLQGR